MSVSPLSGPGVNFVDHLNHHDRIPGVLGERNRVFRESSPSHLAVQNFLKALSGYTPVGENETRKKPLDLVGTFFRTAFSLMDFKQLEYFYKYLGEIIKRSPAESPKSSLPESLSTAELEVIRTRVFGEDYKVDSYTPDSHLMSTGEQLNSDTRYTDTMKIISGQNTFTVNWSYVLNDSNPEQITIAIECTNLQRTICKEKPLTDEDLIRKLRSNHALALANDSSVSI